MKKIKFLGFLMFLGILLSCSKQTINEQITKTPQSLSGINGA